MSPPFFPHPFLWGQLSKHSLETAATAIVAIPGVISSGRQLIPPEWNGCQEMGSECQHSPPVLHCQLASQVHLWGQPTNQNKGKRAPLFVAAQQTSSARRKLVSRKSLFLERAEKNIFSAPSAGGRKLWLVHCSQSDIPGSGCKRVREVIPPLSLSHFFFFFFAGDQSCIHAKGLWIYACRTAAHWNVAQSLH